MQSTHHPSRVFLFHQRKLTIEIIIFEVQALLQPHKNEHFLLENVIVYSRMKLIKRPHKW